VALEVVEVVLLRVRRAVYLVEDLEARLRQARGVHEPPEEGVGLVVEPETDEGVERPARIAQPGEAVVPVAAAADPLGERGSRRGDDRPGGREDEQLERQRAADDGVAPRAV